MANNELKKYKVVLTGFGPFQNVAVNESWLTVSKLWEMDWPSELRLVTRELPVIYDIAKSEIKKLWTEEKPDLMIHCGVHRTGDRIFIEASAFNNDYLSCDVKSEIPHKNICIEDGCEILETKLNVDRLTQVSNKILKENNFKAFCGTSNDPGRYLCGFSYYISLSIDSTKSLFVHVPSQDLFNIDEMALALRAIIFDALNQLYGFNSNNC